MLKIVTIHQKFEERKGLRVVNVETTLKRAMPEYLKLRFPRLSFGLSRCK